MGVLTYVAMKTQVIKVLGEDSLTLPAQIKAGLAANDRLKYYFTLLQVARSHADQPDQPASSLKKERLVAGIHDKDGEQLRRLGFARVAADLMARARRFGPALARLVDAGLAVIDLRFDLARKDVGENEGGFRMGVRRRRGARRIIDFDGDERFSRNVGDRLIESGRDGFGLTVVRRRGANKRGRGASGGDSSADPHGASPSAPKMRFCRP